MKCQKQSLLSIRRVCVVFTALAEEILSTGKTKKFVVDMML
jgi:hypothetical protein